MCWAAEKDSDTAHAVNMLTYTYAIICVAVQTCTQTHTSAHTHTAGPGQLTPCHSTDHIQSSSGTGGHMWIIIHANEMNKKGI